MSRGIPIVSPGACYLVLNTLRDLVWSGAEFYWQQYQSQWPIAWKTGTSYGHRDAWAVGVTPQWTLAVWVGNFDGVGTPELVGSRCAGPLLFDLFNALQKDPEKSWFVRPDAELRSLDLCADTGYRKGPNCPSGVAGDAPRSQRPLKVCPFHQTVTVTVDETERVCSLCWTPGDHARVARLVYSPDVADLLRKQGRSAGDLPPHRADCPAQADRAPMRIVYPGQNARLWLPRDLDGARQNVVLRVAHRDRDRTLYWYLNHRYLGQTVTQHDRAVVLPVGWHTLAVVDDAGYRDQARFYVASGQ